MTRRPAPAQRVPVVRLGDRAAGPRHDRVAGEEPLQIRLVAGPPGARGARADVAVTLRTPGHDFELAAGFLFAEGLLRSRDDLLAIRYCSDVPPEQRYNVVHVHVRGDALPDLARLERHFTVNSACGVCGKAHLDALEVRCDGPLPAGPSVPLDVLLALPAALRAGQTLFDATGGLHAAGAFDETGRALAIREDVGRHNALDKLLGWALLEGVDLEAKLACVSGRASYELLQKAVAGRFTVLAAVSAPSSLAIAVAQRFGVTLAGFVRGGGCNVYAGVERVVRGPIVT